MAGLSTLPDDDLKGNEADSRDLAQQHADNLHRSAPLSEADADTAELARMEKAEAAGEGDRSLADATPEERRAALASQEAPEQNQSLYSKSSDNTSDGKLAGRLMKAARRRGPTGGIIGLILAMFGFSSLMLAPGSLLVAIEKAVTNDAADSTRTNIVFRRAYVANLFNKDKPAAGSSKIENELTSMTDEQKALWEKEGFKVELTEEGRIEKMTFPDGKAVEDGKAFTDYAENTPEGRKAVSNVIDARASPFDSAEFKALLDTFHISKSKVIKPSSETDPDKRREAENKAFDENTGLNETGGDSPDAVEARRKALESETIGQDGTKLSSSVKKIADSFGQKAGLAGLVASPVSLACATYNVAKLTNATIKAQWIYDLVSYAYPFVRAAAQIEDQGSIDPSVVESLGDRLTWFNTNKNAPDYDKSAMDSQGLQMAIYGDYAGLTTFTQKFTSWGWEVSLDTAASDIINFVNNTIGKGNAKSACRVAHETQQAAVLACATGIIQLITCGGAVLAADLAEKYLVPEVIVLLGKSALHFLATVDLSSLLKGEGAGDAIAAGLGLLLSNQSLGSGLIPAGGKNGLLNVKNFITMTDSANYTYTTQLALDQAKEDPWDVTNQYSFMGQLASMINPYVTTDGTLFGKLANITSVTSSSFANLATIGTANALHSQPSLITAIDGAAANRTGSCLDPDMADIDALCDWSGRPIGYTSPEVLNGLNDISNGTAGSNNILTSSINYMTSPNNNDINPDTGAPIPGSAFEKYYNNCIIRKNPNGPGTMPLGSSIEPITSDDYDWSDGSRCMAKDSGSSVQATNASGHVTVKTALATSVGKVTLAASNSASNNNDSKSDPEMLNAFSTYYNWCYIQYSMANHVNNCFDKTPTDNASAASTAPTGSIAQVAQEMGTWGGQYQACYIEGGGHGTLDDLKQRIANHFAPIQYGVDCSGFTRAVIYTATGKDPGGLSTSAMCASPEYEHIPRAQAQPGDLAIRCDTHVEVITDVNGGNFKTVGSHTRGCGPSFGPSPGNEQGNKDFVLRFKG